MEISKSIDWYLEDEPWDRKPLIKYLINPDWEEFFQSQDLQKIQETLSQDIPKIIYPNPKLIFGTFNLISPEAIKVVILGQDPYHTPGMAMGLSFSVPPPQKIPPSLKTIHQSLLKYHHIQKLPDHGSLLTWVAQGCFLLNVALTVLKNQAGSHQELWKDFTRSLLRYLNHRENIVYLIWGRQAYEVSSEIDQEKNCLLISGHPSPLARGKGFRQFPGFLEIDHFGEANRYLITKKKEPLQWDWIID